MTLLTIEDEKFAEGRILGREEGRNLGREEGRAEGQQSTQRSIYERLIADGMSANKASIITGWTVNSPSL